MSPFLPTALVDFMHQHQYWPEPLKQSGGGFLRFPAGKEANGDTSGYVKLSPDGNSAVFGDFISGTQIIWNVRDEKTISSADREAYRDCLDETRQQIKEERCRRQAIAADKGAEIYKSAKAPQAHHPYLVRKGIHPCGGIRQLGNQLLVPVYIEGKLTSLQFIDENGNKRFLSGGEISGGYCLLGAPVDLVCIAEGYATGCSIHASSGNAVAVAFNAGNLMHAALAIRRQYKEATLILCADDDQWTEGNPGLTKATQAALAVEGLLALPDFSECNMSSRPTDFNDLHTLSGQDAVTHAVRAARKAGSCKPTSELRSSPYPKLDQKLQLVGSRVEADDPDFNPHAKTNVQAAATPVAMEIERTGEVPKGRISQVDGSGLKAIKREDAPRNKKSDAPLAPPTMPEVGFPPLIRDIVEVACNSSEAHPVAVAANVLAYFSATIGRVVFQRIGDAVIHCRPFPLIVGKSGKARKGTAESTVRKIFKRVDAITSKRRGVEEHLRCHTGGLSTGEGIAWNIRDPVEADEKGRGGDPGVMDKRLLAIESEFDNVLSQLRRDNNTLSATIRNLFDGRDIEPLTKNSPTRATRPHVSVLGHITGYELREKATATDVANGLLNRFLMLYVYRPKLVALPRPTSEARIEELAQRVADAIMVITDGNLHADNIYEVNFSDAARDLWVEQYPSITRDREGKGGSLLARSEMYARMLAMIFAAMDSRLIIEEWDLHAAIAWVEYWNASVNYIFNCGDDEGTLDPEAAKVFEIIKAKPGISLSELQSRCNNKASTKVTDALKLLLGLAPPLIEEHKRETAGRPALTYFVHEKK
ncbi:putative DNA primase/helicase [Nitrosospira sp. Nl5]|uniref:DUF3987 domain-containing protein n=1 Tax=Nitrosospira sp. Nl5 TaxID=200120 RepID=UPI00088D4095|nr:DUF3987 domain-containing protein [Nitrosospira sp. Nl5]SCY62497.1 putative DNA primase/helicase [Nitrosospira sp. Nl5]